MENKNDKFTCADKTLVEFTVSAPGKIILFGEHSVVYGKSALAASINRRTYVKLMENVSSSNISNATRQDGSLPYSSKSDICDDSIKLKMNEIQFECTLEFSKILDMIKLQIPKNNSDMSGNCRKNCTSSSSDYNSKLSASFLNPSDVDHDKYINVLNDYIEKNLFSDKLRKSELAKFNGIQRTSFMVFLYLLHSIFCNSDDHNSNVVTQPLVGCDAMSARILSPVTVDISTELPLGAGNGSSASFCVSIASALLLYRNIKLCGHDLVEAENITFSKQGLKVISDWAFNGEKILHGKPSGLDNTVATLGSFIEVKSHDVTGYSMDGKKTFLAVPDPPKIRVLLINTCVSRITPKLVAKVIDLRGRFCQSVNHILDAMHWLCEQATEIIKQMSDGQSPHLFKSLEDLVDMNHGLLYSLGVSHQSLQDVCFVCSQYDLHAKLTGAGGGGCAYAFIPQNFDQDKLSTCIDKLQKSGYEVMPDVELGIDGVRLEHGGSNLMKKVQQPGGS